MPKKILLIDDEELITRTLANALEKQGYEVLVAKSGNDAIVMAEEEDFEEDMDEDDEEDEGDKDMS